jgi:hypothetical protein
LASISITIGQYPPLSELTVADIGAKGFNLPRSQLQELTLFVTATPLNVSMESANV